MKKAIIIILVLAAVVGVGLYVRKRMQLASSDNATKPTGTPTGSNAPLGVVSINVNTSRTKLQAMDAQAGAEDVQTGVLLS